MIEPSVLLPTRVPWCQFPEVIVHSSIHKLKGSFGYFSAKRGNHRNALKVANALVKLQKIQLPFDFVVPVIQVDQGHYNALPVALAAVLAKSIGAKVWLDVCQINKVNHSGTTPKAQRCAPSRRRKPGATAPTEFRS